MYTGCIVINLLHRVIGPYNCHGIGDVIVRVRASSVVDRGFEPRSGQTKKTTKLVFVISLPSTQH